jgi:hypothetical protein
LPSVYCHIALYVVLFVHKKFIILFELFRLDDASNVITDRNQNYWLSFRLICQYSILTPMIKLTFDLHQIIDIWSTISFFSTNVDPLLKNFFRTTNVLLFILLLIKNFIFHSRCPAMWQLPILYLKNTLVQLDTPRTVNTWKIQLVTHIYAVNLTLCVCCMKIL